MRICIVICEMDRPTELRGTLESIRNQTVQPAYVLISDDSADWETTKKVIETFDFPILYYQHLGSTGLTSNRNYACSKVPKDATHILFLDDDVVLDSNYIFEMSDAIRSHPHAVGFTGYIRTEYYLRPWYQKIALLLIGMANPEKCPASFNTLKLRRGVAMYPVFPPKTPIAADWLSGCNMLYKKSVFDKGYRFDIMMTGYCPMEDVVFSNALVRDGYELLMVPTAQLVHLQRGFLK